MRAHGAGDGVFALRAARQAPSVRPSVSFHTTYQRNDGENYQDGAEARLAPNMLEDRLYSAARSIHISLKGSSTSVWR